MSRLQAGPAATASWDLLRIVARAATELGLEAERIYGGYGIDLSLLAQPFERLPIHLARSAWTQTAIESGASALGIQLAGRMSLGALGVLDELLATSSTLDESFRRLIRFGALLADAGEMSLIVTGNRARFVHFARDGVPFISHMVVALVVRRIREIAVPGWAPRSVAFAGAEPAQTADFEDWFEAPVEFGQPVDEIVFDRELLDAKLAERAASQGSELWVQAERAVASLQSAHQGFGELYAAIAAGVASGNTKLDVIADELGISVRTLQRRLRELGTGHRELVEHLRAQFATAELTRASVLQRQVGQHLGYASPSSFHRALRRWDGKRRTGRAGPVRR